LNGAADARPYAIHLSDNRTGSSDVFWLEGEVSFTTERLNVDLKTYLEGLSRAVEQANEKLDPKKATVTAHLQETKSPKDKPQRFEGTVNGYDPFTTHGPLTLNVRVTVFRCPAQSRTVAFFQTSPQQMTHEVWQTLKPIRQVLAVIMKRGNRIIGRPGFRDWRPPRAHRVKGKLASLGASKAPL
jgi:hypothetical protein